MQTAARTSDRKWTSEAICRSITGSYGCLEGASVACAKKAISNGQVRTFQPGGKIVSAGQDVERLFYVLEGTVRTYTVSKDGRKHLLSMLKRGALWGIIYCFGGGPSHHELSAEGEVTVLEVSVPDFLDLIHSNKEFRDAMLRIMAIRFRIGLSILDGYAFGSPRARLAHRLLMFARSHGKEENGADRINLHLTQDSLASMVGLTRQRLSPILKSFQQDGLIEIKYGKLLLADMDGLRAIVTEIS